MPLPLTDTHIPATDTCCTTLLHSLNTQNKQFSTNTNVWQFSSSSISKPQDYCSQSTEYFLLGSTNWITCCHEQPGTDPSPSTPPVTYKRTATTARSNSRQFYTLSLHFSLSLLAVSGVCFSDFFPELIFGEVKNPFH